MPQRRMSTEEYREKVRLKHGDKVDVLSNYNGGTEPIDIIFHCIKHGDVLKTLNAKNVFAKSFQPCKECDLENKSSSGLNRLMDKNQLYQRLKDYVENKGGSLITKKWTTAKALYEIQCENGHIFQSNADSLINKPQWCPYCCGRKGDFETEINEIIHIKNGTLLGRYKNASTHVKVKCNIHNYEWDIMPMNIKKGRWCPICCLPYSEKVVYDYLVNNKIKFEIQYTFENLKSDEGELLKFDFAILDTADKLLGLLEVDDNEHRYNHTQPRRVRARHRDYQKNDYCELNNIKLFRLKYISNSKEFQNYNWYYKYIESELTQYLTSLKQKQQMTIEKGGVECLIDKYKYTV